MTTILHSGILEKKRWLGKTTKKCCEIFISNIQSVRQDIVNIKQIEIIVNDKRNCVLRSESIENSEIWVREIRKAILSQNQRSIDMLANPQVCVSPVVEQDDSDDYIPNEECSKQNNNNNNNLETNSGSDYANDSSIILILPHTIAYRSRKINELKRMATKLSESDAIRIQDQNLVVALRIRPISEEEICVGATPIAHCVDKNMVVLMDPLEDPDDILRANRSREKQYVFDLGFDGNATQEEVYVSTCRLLIPNVIKGFNASVFAYGATGAGKTHTMLGTDREPGIMARALNDLFLEMDRTKEDMSYKVTMSYLEIYNEMIRDLLNPGSGFLELREDAKGVQVAGLSEVSARSTREVMDMLMKGNKERTQEPTAANKTSSRSHAVLQVTVRQRDRVRDILQEVRVGKLFLIDLAGSERAANTQNTGKRMIEGAHINRSLLALGNVINTLSDKNSSRYVNYRDSKLTRLLKDSLGGNCKTVMIAHISPASVHFEESRNTLAYADRAKHIKTKVKKTVMEVSHHIAQYNNIITELREEVERLREKLDQQGAVKRNSSALKAIKSEVMQPQEEAELERMKEKLVNNFREQMDLRRQLMDLNNSAMEIHLETVRNQLIVDEHERQKTYRASKRAAEMDDESIKDADVEKDMIESEEVKIARNELVTLDADKVKVERDRQTLEKYLKTARGKTSSLLPTSSSPSPQHREVLALMCRVHELEIEQLETQSACILAEFEIRRRDLGLQKYEQYRSIADLLIRQQRDLLTKNNIEIPRYLDDLYENYTTYAETSLVPELPRISGQRPPVVNNNFKSGVDSLTDIEKHSSRDDNNLPSITEQGVSRRRLYRTKSMLTLPKPGEENEEKVFSHSPKTRHIKEAQLRSLHGTNAAKSTPAINRAVAHNQQVEKVIVLSRSNTSTPTAIAKEQAFKDKQLISLNTRSIAARAARKKTRNLEPINDQYLSPSRLAKHDRTYPPQPLPSHGDDTSLGRGRNGRTRRGGYPPFIRHTNRKLNESTIPKKVKVARPGDRRRPKNHIHEDELDSLTPMQNMEKKRFTHKVASSDASTVSTPQTNNSRLRKNNGTIPNYGKGDISVAGHGIR
ncbi:DgyrCDS11934 [Dimorphilus gyrociliatus]|uniref:Kinesin-like protein KIF19 n=1 Tax=Dimorphilus gyrociliatus TaxID=2664684 RepID=A0A7I8W4X2_9ANNE|nr:DgyrCDS11934 [Dimorphilus gyrociliatus]